MVLSVKTPGEPFDLDFKIDVDFDYADDYKKVAAVLLCLQNSGGHTIKSLRECAYQKTPISERIVRRILIRLLERGYCLYDTRRRRWLPTRKLAQLQLTGIADAVKVARSLLRIW